MNKIEFYKEINLKETVVGHVPEDWEVVSVGEILSLEYGKGLPEKERIIGEYPVVGSNGIVGYHNRSLVKGPGIVIGRKGTIGAVSWVEQDFWPIDTTYHVKLKKENVDWKWLYFALIKLNLPKLHLSDVVPGLKREIAYSLKMPFPPSIEEQRVVAEVLSVVDLAVQRTDMVIAKTERLKKGLMQTLLTRGIGHKEYKETPIGKIPKTWQIIKLAEITTKIKDIDHKMPEKVEYGIPFVSVKCMLKYPDYNFNLDFRDPDLEFIAEKDYLYHKQRFDAEKEDIIYSRFGTIGNAKLIQTSDPFIASYSIVLIKPKKDLVFPLFLVYALNSEKVKLQAKIATKGATNQNLHLEDIQNLRIPLPPIEEQQRIADIILAVDKKLEIEKHEKARLEEIKQGLMDLLLTGKVRVRVN